MRLMGSAELWNNTRLGAMLRALLVGRDMSVGLTAAKLVEDLYVTGGSARGAHTAGGRRMSIVDHLAEMRIRQMWTMARLTGSVLIVPGQPTLS